MATTQRLIREVYPNREIRGYSVTVVISESFFQSFHAPLREASTKYLNAVGEKGEKILKALFAIRGVHEVSISPYQLSVHLANSFSWAEEEPKIIKAISRAFNRRKPVEVMLLDSMGRVDSNQQPVTGLFVLPPSGETSKMGGIGKFLAGLMESLKFKKYFK